ncbi:threonine/serine exporter family protein [Actinomycetospora chlora]|uniref:Threonine/serine exporter family protein n=1 Tax=Actinomycetospora chlora TaxID=663608 RepID=A0ABP9C936_9PSEU
MKFPGVPRPRPEHAGEEEEEGAPVGVAQRAQRARGSLRRQFPVAPDLSRAIDAPTVRDNMLPVVTGPQVADDALVLRVLDLALRVGEVQLATGAGAAVAHDTMLAIARAYGLPTCDVDIAFSTITICCHRGNEAGPVTTMRNVRYRTQDYTRLTEVDDLITAVVDHDDPLPVEEATTRLGNAVRANHPYPRFVAGIARSLFAGAVAVLIGGGLLVAVLAAVATGIVWGAARWLGRRNVPLFFQQMVGAAIVTLSATTLAWSGVLEDSPVFVIAAGIVVLLSGLSLVGLVQDAITGFPLTAAGRAVEVVLSSAGLLVGVVVSIKLVNAVLGTDAVAYAAVVPPGPSPSLDPLSLVAAAGAGMLFALSAYAPWRSLPFAALAGATAWGSYAALGIAGAGEVVAAALAAAALGLVAMLLPRTLGTPPLVLVIAGITPLLPGLTLYRGFSQLAYNSVAQSAVTILLALTFGLALAAGVSVGEQVGWPLQRLIRRLLPGAAEDRARDARRGRPRVF